MQIILCWRLFTPRSDNHSIHYEIAKERLKTADRAVSIIQEEDGL
jgi:hypothetical protein